MMEKKTIIDDDILFESCKEVLDECLKVLFNTRALNLISIPEYENELDAFIVERGNFWKDKFSGMTKEDVIDYVFRDLASMMRGV